MPTNRHSKKPMHHGHGGGKGFALSKMRDTVIHAAETLHRAIAKQNPGVSLDQIEEGIRNLVRHHGAGQLHAALASTKMPTPKYCLSADLISAAHTEYRKNNVQTALELVVHAFEESDIKNLIKGINGMNSKSKLGIQADMMSTDDDSTSGGQEDADMDPNGDDDSSIDEADEESNGLPEDDEASGEIPPGSTMTDKEVTMTASKIVASLNRKRKILADEDMPGDDDDSDDDTYEGDDGDDDSDDDSDDSGDEDAYNPDEDDDDDSDDGSDDDMGDDDDYSDDDDNDSDDNGSDDTWNSDGKQGDDDGADDEDTGLMESNLKKKSVARAIRATANAVSISGKKADRKKGLSILKRKKTRRA